VKNERVDCRLYVTKSVKC